MMNTDVNTTRWTVTVSKNTVIAIRTLLAQRGLTKGDLSKFIEEAVRRRIFDQTLSEVHAGFPDLDATAAQDLINEATEAALNSGKK
jgi:hypothetical protein